MKVKHLVSISGGKDSTALRLLAIEHGIEHIAVFADTGHEHPLTYEYIDYLEEKTGPIIRVKADFSGEFARKRMFIARDQRTGRKCRKVEKVDQYGKPVYVKDKHGRTRLFPVYAPNPENIDESVLVGMEPRQVIGYDGGRKVRWSNKAKRRALAALYPTGIPFLDLCMLKGRFPSNRVRFCSEQTKHEPIFNEIVDPLLTSGIEVISWQGVRADESLARRDLLRIEEVGGGLWNYRPIIDWTVDDVFEMHRRHGIEPNPLYKMGMGRVGCMPCIHARKDELRAIASRFPEVIDRVEEWERIVAACSKRNNSTLFPVVGTVFDDGNEKTYLTHGIRKHVEWAKTTRGGRQYDLIAGMEDFKMCSSIYGLCG